MNDYNENETSQYSMSDHLTKMLTPSVAEALVPLNFQKLPAHALATQLINQEPGIENVPNQWLDNLDATEMYLDDSHNATHYMQRAQKVGFDFGVVNVCAELPFSLGSIFAADYSNQAARQYMEEMGEDREAMDPGTEWSCLVRLRGGPGSKYNSPETMPFGRYSHTGTGVFQQNLPKSERKNPIGSLFDNHGRTRPLWTYKFRGGQTQLRIVDIRFYKTRLFVQVNIARLKMKLIALFGSATVANKVIDFMLLFGYIMYCYKIFRLMSFFYKKYRKYRKMGFRRVGKNLISQTSSYVKGLFSDVDSLNYADLNYGY